VGREEGSAGYTLIELAVVLALLGVMLFAALPNLKPPALRDPLRLASNRLVAQLQGLKERAVADGVSYTLHIGIDTGRFWATRVQAGDEADQQAEQQAYVLPREVRILDVELVGRRKITTGEASLAFSPAGYSDHAVIHLQAGTGRYRTFLLEPFLSHVKRYDRYWEMP
jgi:prepilin-type N-terminal cleavage/methylation domain-containing protein